MAFSKFKKTCFQCGKKTNKLKENLCLECFRENTPITETIKPLNIKFCNMCGKIHYNNSLIDIEKFQKLLPNIIKKNIKLNENYELEKIEIENFEIEGIKIDFDIKIKAKLKE